jgi:hypothetical protein
MKSATEAVKLPAEMPLDAKQETTSSTKRVLEPCIKLPLDPALFSELVKDARDFALLNGEEIQEEYQPPKNDIVISNCAIQVPE